MSAGTSCVSDEVTPEKRLRDRGRAQRSLPRHHARGSFGLIIRGTAGHDIIVRGLRIRDAFQDGIWVTDAAYNVVIDHVSDPELRGRKDLDITRTRNPRHHRLLEHPRRAGRRREEHAARFQADADHASSQPLHRFRAEKPTGHVRRFCGEGPGRRYDSGHAKQPGLELAGEATEAGSGMAGRPTSSTTSTPRMAGTRPTP